MNKDRRHQFQSCMEKLAGLEEEMEVRCNNVNPACACCERGS